MDAPRPLKNPVYKLDDLIGHFQAALDSKNAQIGKLPLETNPWMRTWPQGNSKIETTTLDWLKAQKRERNDAIQTQFPIPGKTPLSDPQHSLYMQIKNGQARGIKLLGRS